MAISEYDWPMGIKRNHYALIVDRLNQWIIKLNFWRTVESFEYIRNERLFTRRSEGYASLFVLC